MRKFVKSYIGVIMLSLLVFVLSPATALKEGFPAEVKGANPSTSSQQVKSLVGVYITDIYNLNLAEATFDVSFWVWWLNSLPNHKPQEQTEISNARQSTIEYPFQEKIGNMVRSEARYRATVNVDWNIKHLPFDKQTLNIILENANIPLEKLKLIPDLQNSGMAPNIKIHGWKIKSFSMREGTTENFTNFGNPHSTDSTKYSNITFAIEVQRNALSMFINLFIGFFISSFVCMMIYFFPVQNIDFRAELLVIATLASVGNKYILDTLLPQDPSITLSDKIQFLTFGIIMTSLLSMAFTHILYRNGKKNLAKYSNVILSIASPIIYIGLLAYFVLVAMEGSGFIQF